MKPPWQLITAKLGSQHRRCLFHRLPMAQYGLSTCMKRARTIGVRFRLSRNCSAITRTYRKTDVYATGETHRLTHRPTHRDTDTSLLPVHTRHSMPVCEHNRQRAQRKDCGGTGICEHNKRRTLCKECGGASICEHNVVHSLGKDCGCNSICKHNRRRVQCKDCGGASICEHERLRDTCKGQGTTRGLGPYGVLV
eukprot:393384-Rhodomonas_salina.2